MMMIKAHIVAIKTTLLKCATNRSRYSTSTIHHHPPIERHIQTLPFQFHPHLNTSHHPNNQPTIEQTSDSPGVVVILLFDTITVAAAQNHPHNSVLEPRNSVYLGLCSVVVVGTTFKGKRIEAAAVEQVTIMNFIIKGG